jgi:type I restriction enzyme S subunit
VLPTTRRYPRPRRVTREITKDSEKHLTSTEAGLTEEGAKRSRYVYPGDLLLTNSGATLGVPKISSITGCINDGVAVLRQFHSVPVNDFAYVYLQSQTESFRAVKQGMGQPNLNTGIIAGWFFAFPPLEEQQRIVAKIADLMTLCDQLESAITVAHLAARRLLEAVLTRALDATSQSANSGSQRRPIQPRS